MVGGVIRNTPVQFCRKGGLAHVSAGSGVGSGGAVIYQKLSNWAASTIRPLGHRRWNMMGPRLRGPGAWIATSFIADATDSIVIATRHSWLIATIASTTIGWAPTAATTEELLLSCCYEELLPDSAQQQWKMIWSLWRNRMVVDRHYNIHRYV
jgi:hypothetical protein